MAHSLFYSNLCMKKKDYAKRLTIYFFGVNIFSTMDSLAIAYILWGASAEIIPT